MATDINWPESLRGAIQRTQTIQSSAGFIESNPAAGPSYTQFLTDMKPTFIQFDLVFTKTQAQYFSAWANQNEIFKIGAFFNFPVRDEYDLNYQECRFVPSGIPSASLSGNTVTYSGCRLLVPKYSTPDQEMLLSFYDIFGADGANGMFEAIDIAINQNWPGN